VTNAAGAPFRHSRLPRAAAYRIDREVYGWIEKMSEELVQCPVAAAETLKDRVYAC